MTYTRLKILFSLSIFLLNFDKFLANEEIAQINKFLGAFGEAASPQKTGPGQGESTRVTPVGPVGNPVDHVSLVGPGDGPRPAALTDHVGLVGSGDPLSPVGPGPTGLRGSTGQKELTGTQGRGPPSLTTVPGGPGGPEGPEGPEGPVGPKGPPSLTTVPSEPGAPPSLTTVPRGSGGPQSGLTGTGRTGSGLRRGPTDQIAQAGLAMATGKTGPMGQKQTGLGRGPTDQGQAESAVGQMQAGQKGFAGEEKMVRSQPPP